jgi:hypothetical protein
MRTPPGLEELQAPCGRCGHQNAVHTAGARRGGWAIYEPLWADAAGRCSAAGCLCPQRVTATASLPQLPTDSHQHNPRRDAA